MNIWAKKRHIIIEVRRLYEPNGSPQTLVVSSSWLELHSAFPVSSRTKFGIVRICPEMRVVRVTSTSATLS